MADFNTVAGVVQGYMEKYPTKFQPADKWVLQRHAISWFHQRESKLGPAKATVEIMLQSDRSAVLPTDFVDWLVVGQRRGDEIVNLGFNERVNRLPPAHESIVPTSPDAPLAMRVPYYGWLHGDLYGYGAGEYPSKEFVIDTGLGKLFTNSEVEPGPLYLQYIYNPDKPDVATPLSSKHLMVLEYWIEWQLNRQANDSQKYKSQYFNELKDVSMGESAGGIESYYNIFDNKAYGQI
jgi:hypothetical protein